MLRMTERTLLHRALDAPSEMYPGPMAVVRDGRLDEVGRRAVLSAWESDVRRACEVAGDGRIFDLVAVQAAIAVLDRRQGLL